MIYMTPKTFNGMLKHSTLETDKRRKILRTMDGCCYKPRKNGKYGIIIDIGTDKAETMRVTKVKC